VAANGAAFSTITVTLLDGNYNPVPGQMVTLSVSGTGNTVSTPSVSDANGQTTATLTSTNAGTKTVTASVGTTTINQHATVTFVAGAVSALASTVSVNPNNNVTADGSAAGTITVSVKDGNSNGIPGQTVTLSVSGTGNTVSTPPVTDASGQTTATLTSTNAGTKTVTASVGTTTITQQPTLTFVPGAATRLVFATQPGSATYGAPLSPQPVVKTKDAFGNDSAVGLGASKLVSLAVSAGTGSLQGTASLDIGTSAGNGIVSFSGLKVSAAGTGKQLTASASSLASATSATFGINPANSTATLVSSVNPSPFGSNVTFTVTLAPVSPATGTPSGSVQFLTNGVALGGPVPLSGGVAAVSTAQLPSGSNVVAAAYFGDGNFLGSSNSLVQVVSLDVQPPTTLRMKANSDGTVTVTFQGTPGAQYVVQARADLVSAVAWENVSTNTASSDGTWTFTESTVGYSQRYFRSAKP
jgi:hypothetical protein